MFNLTEIGSEISTSS